MSYTGTAPQIPITREMDGHHHARLFEKIPTPPRSARPGTGEDHLDKRLSTATRQLLSSKVAWTDSHSGNYMQNIMDRDSHTQICKKAIAEVAAQKARIKDQVFWTYAANQPDFERKHGAWRTGIARYSGFRPHFAEMKHFFTRKEVGKLHPPYVPTTEAGALKGEAKRTKISAPAHRLGTPSNDWRGDLQKRH